MPTAPTPKKARAKPPTAVKRRAAAKARATALLLGKRKAAFLRCLEATHLVTEAAKAAQVHRSTVYEWRAGDEAFAAAWDDSEERSTELLEREAYRRAAVGVKKGVYHKGQRVDEVTEYSDVLLIFLLKARRPATYREHHTLEHVGPGGGPVSVRVDLDAKGRKALGDVLRSRPASRDDD